MQQGTGTGSGFGSSSGFCSGATTSSTAIGAFARTQTPFASTSSTPPNTFSRPPSQYSSSTAFPSNNNIHQQPSFGNPRPLNGRPRPQPPQSGFSGPRSFNGGQQSRPPQTSFNRSRPPSGQQFQSQQQQQQQQSTFGNRPRPFTSRSTEGRPPNSGAFRGGGRGGGMIRPNRPLASHSNTNQQAASMDDGSASRMDAANPDSLMHTPRPRPQPFANKSTTFNALQQAAPAPSALASFNPYNNQMSAASSVFGVQPPLQSNGSVVPSGSAFKQPGSSFSSAQLNTSASSQTSSSPTTLFNQPSSSFPSTKTTTSFGHNTSTLGSTASSDKPSATAFGSAQASDSVPTFGSKPQSSAFGGVPAAPSSAFGGGSTTISTFGSPFSAAQPPTSAASATSSTPVTHTLAPAAVSSAPAAPTSSFSNFLRKDRTGTSTPGDGSGSPFRAGGSAGTEDEDELRKKRFEDAPKVGNRFLEMKGGREALRNAYIKSGILPDPDKPTDLALAVKLVGTCQDMCPEFEREEREFQKELDPLELYPGTDRVDPRIAVKIYRRPAAGRELPLPEDVRPPPVLKRTLDYLFHDLLPSDPNDPRFTAVQGFLWNRTRAVRQDFIVQSEGGPIAIECHERIARYHILCLHWRGGPGAEGWSEQQELEQLRKTMRSLIEFYDDNRRKSSSSGAASTGQPSPNEAEFRAYNLLLHLRDPETLREAELLPGNVFRSPLVQTALNLRQLAQRSNNLEKRGQPRNTEATLNFFSKFFAELRKPNVNYLMACLAENSFSSIRIGAVKALSKAYMAQHRALPIERVQHLLGMDSAEQVLAMVKHLGLELEYEAETVIGVKIHRTAAINEDKPLATPFSSTIVEAKRGSWSSADVVDGRASASAIVPTSQARPQAPPAASKPSNAPPTFGLKQQQGPPSAFDSSASSAFDQQQSQQKESSPSAFGSASPSKLTAAASPFTPSYSAPASSGTRTSIPATAFGRFTRIRGSDHNDDSTAKPSMPSFGAVGKDTAQAKQESSVSHAFLRSKITASTPQSPDLQDRSSSLPSFSFGQPAAKSPFGAQSIDGSKERGPKPKTSAASPFSFGTLQKADTESSKPSIPSFFTSSLASKESTRAEPESKSTAVTALKPVEIEKGSAPSSTTTSKRRDSNDNGFAAVQAAVAAKVDAEERAQALRKNAARNYAVGRAFRTLFDEVVRSAAAKSAARAVHEEEARRRAESRNKVLAHVADRLWQRLADEVAVEATEKLAQVAAADVFCDRSCVMRAYQQWHEALDERRDREQQRQRLEDIRNRIKERDILDRNQAEATPGRYGMNKLPPSTEQKYSPISRAFSIRRALLTGERGHTPADSSAARLKRKLDKDSSPDRRTPLQGDAALMERYTSVRRQRDQLWAEGSLLHRLADHIEDLLLHFRPADLDRLVVLYSGAPDQHVASSWLRIKFGFSSAAPTDSKNINYGRDLLEVDLADGSRLEIADITGSEVDAILPKQDEGGQVGLVIFEKSPAAAQAKTVKERNVVDEGDRARLLEVAQTKMVRESRLAVGLLVVAWGGTDVASASSADVDGDAEMSDADLVRGINIARSETILTSLGLNRNKANTNNPATLRSVSVIPTSSLVSRTFDRVGVVSLDDASVSIDDTFATLLSLTIPDLSPNPNLYLRLPHRSSVQHLVHGLYDQWSRTSGLLFDLLSGDPPRVPSASFSSSSASQVEGVACKTLQILTALANHILRTVLNLSETIIKDNEEDTIKLAIPSPHHDSASAGSKLVDMALWQIDSLVGEEQDRKLLLRSQLLSSLGSSPKFEEVIRGVNREHVDELFRLSLGKLSQVWIGIKPGSENEWIEAKESLGTLCSKAVDEIAHETRRIWNECESRITQRDREIGLPSKRVRVESAISSPPVLEVTPKANKVNELRNLVARTKRFLDSPSS